MSGLPIPQSPEELTAGWLTAALRQAGAITRASVKALEIEPNFAAGAGFMGNLSRLSLTYDAAEDGAPARLVAKLPPPSPEARQVADAFRLFEREVRFYEQIAGTADLRTARCYYHAFDPGTRDFVLLLEDLAPARCGDQVTGCTLAQTELAIRELAKFHATWWEHPKLSKLDWLPHLNAPFVQQSVHSSYSEGWGPFLANYGDRLSPQTVSVGERVGRHFGRILDHLSTPPLTIAHGDYRLDNLFFSTAEGGAPLAVVDWQVAYHARGSFDVGYFITGTLPPAERRAGDTKLLELYRAVLIDNGVQHYSFDELLHDYRMAILCSWVYAVIILGTLDTATERGLALFNSALERIVAAVEDWNAGELIPA